MTDFSHPPPSRTIAAHLPLPHWARRALRIALWALPPLVLLVWLCHLPIWPTDAVQGGYGLLCSAASAITRAAQTVVTPKPPPPVRLTPVAAAATTAPPPHLAPVQTVPGMAPVLNPANLYSAAGPNMLSPAVAGALPRIYVPNLRSGDVYVIDPATRRVIDRFTVGVIPQHVVPAFDLQTLWVANNGRRHAEGSLTPIDPKTGRPGPSLPVADPYNMYFTPDGKSAIVVAERLKRLDFRDPHTMALQESLPTPGCSGINHADFSIDGRYAIFTCEFRGGGLVKIDMVERKVVGYLRLDDTRSMLQDIRVSPDGKVFYVADMLADGVFLVDGDSFTRVGFIPTGIGTHGLYPSRDGTRLYVTNRGSHKVHGPPHGPGSISVIDFATRTVEKTWPIPGGGSPDMGNVSADGRNLWLSGRYDNVVYDIDTTTGAVSEIRVGKEPHGLTVWPQPGRYSFGHTGNMR
jgi:YVTN family beta-propeller protein